MTSYPAQPDWISLCMIVAIGSYELQYGLNGLMKSVVRPEYHDLAAKFWKDYKLDFDRSRPFPTGADLLVPGFFDGFTDARNSAFLRHFAANRASYWSYDSPIRFHYGLADEAIHPAMVSAPWRLAASSPAGSRSRAAAIAAPSSRASMAGRRRWADPRISCAGSRACAEPRARSDMARPTGNRVGRHYVLKSLFSPARPLLYLPTAFAAWSIHLLISSLPN